MFALKLITDDASSCSGCIFVKVLKRCPHIPIFGMDIFIGNKKWCNREFSIENLVHSQWSNFSFKVVGNLIAKAEA